MAIPIRSRSKSSAPTLVLPPEAWPDESLLVTEDDTPVENWYQERQMTLLREPLALAWSARDEARHLLVGTDIGLFSTSEPTVVPDVIVGFPAHGIADKRIRSWFTWRFGAPELVAEIVSNTEGDELGKLGTYAALRVPVVVIWDPDGYLGQKPLRIYRLRQGHYRLSRSRFIAELGLGLTVWHGTFRDLTADWLRWCRSDGTLLLSPEEWTTQVGSQAEAALARAQHAESRAQDAETRANAEKARADAETKRANRLAETLKSLGITPE
jgi:Uma2 family endonuclease